MRSQGYPVYGQGGLERQQGLSSQQGLLLVSDFHGESNLLLPLAPPVGDPAADVQVFDLRDGLQELIGFWRCQAKGVEDFSGGDEAAMEGGYLSLLLQGGQQLQQLVPVFPVFLERIGKRHVTGLSLCITGCIGGQESEGIRFVPFVFHQVEVDPVGRAETTASGL